jgi:hypothetical protein
MFLLSGLDRSENWALVRVLSGLVLVLVIVNFDEMLGNLPVWPLAVVTTPSVCDCRALSGRDRCLRADRFGLWHWPAVATHAEVLASPGPTNRRCSALCRCSLLSRLAPWLAASPFRSPTRL